MRMDVHKRAVAVPCILAIALSLSACANDGSPSEAATPTSAAANPEADVAAARDACNTAIIRRWPRAIDPTLYAFDTTGSGDSYTTTGNINVDISGPVHQRFSFTCNTSREDGVFISTITAAEVPPSETPSPTSTATRTPIPQTSTPLSPRCKTPSESTIAAINASFKEDGYYLADVYMVYGAQDVAYIGANIMAADGHRASSADIWADRGGLLFSLSGDARRRTSLPDGRHLLDISAGDEYGQEVAECIQTAVINRNSTGGR